ncbi:Erf-like ssDNA annealing protein [Thermus phage phiYS40]|uniref:Erf-like ssDNA annealing protein n=1 Tax=Thermus phage phiYS40 TaxID=407392 RepID=UPI0000E68983|nr:Erf-like ssDNA annealing protein [Thermus phage phiYS40]ABJ91407.1 recombination protein ERF [Thermus phage phiYS40]BAK53531.1 recombination protein ERF [Thermus phage phiYS40]
MTEKEIRIELMRPFPDQAILFRVDKKLKNGSYLIVPYLDVRYIIHRLNTMIPGDWELKTEITPITVETTDKSGFLIVGHMAKAELTIMGKTMTGTGSSYLVFDNDLEKLKKQFIKADPKSAETDAIRRAAANHSIGLYIWFFKNQIFATEEELKNRNSKPIQEALANLRIIGDKLYRQAKEYALGKRGGAE